MIITNGWLVRVDGEKVELRESFHPGFSLSRCHTPSALSASLSVAVECFGLSLNHKKEQENKCNKKRRKEPTTVLPSTPKT